MLKRSIILLLFSISAVVAYGQDIVLISDGNFIKGTIKATNFSSVILKNDDETITQYDAKDIKEFVWNGETYVSKPIVIKKKMEFRFFKLIEGGAVNLYEIGGNTTAEEPQSARTKVRPSVSIGGGSGGLGGGIGGGISFGSGRRSNAGDPVKRVMPAAYFIEKIGTGPLMEIPVEGAGSDVKNQRIKNTLLQKLTDDEDLAERIKATENFDAKLVKAFVAAYNSMKK